MLAYSLLIHDTKGHSSKNEIHLPNNLNKFYIFFHVKVQLYMQQLIKIDRPFTRHLSSQRSNIESY